MKYKIGELAKLLNISINTVRRYENQGYIHAVRNEDSGYRYYDEDGVFDITNIRLLRKYGFPHEKLLEMQSYTIQEEIAAYQERMQQMDKEIAYMTYVRHRIKDDVLLMQKAAQMIDVYEKDCVEQIYVLYKEGGKLLQEAGRLKKIEEFLYQSPEVQHIYLIPQKELEQGRFTICNGWSVKDMHMEKYSMTENEYTVRYRQKPSIMGIVKIPATLEELSGYEEETLKQLMIGRHLQYMKEHHMCINGDIIGVIVSKAVENGKPVMYLLMSVPIVSDVEQNIV